MRGRRVLQIQHDGQITNSVIPKACQVSPEKIFRFTEHSNQVYGSPQPAPPGRGRLRDRHGTLERVAMDAVASGDLVTRRNAAAYGEVVWSWRRDRGVKSAGVIPLATVARNAAHRGEHV